MEEHFEEETAAFTAISEDILINIFSKLEDDPRYLANLACVCTRFSSLIRTICWRKKCIEEIPTVVGDLLQTVRSATRLEDPPGGWAALQKLAVCCPGLWHAGVLLESWDYGLERDIGPSEHYNIETRQVQNPSNGEGSSEIHASWTLFDDLHYDTEYRSEVGFAQNRSEETVLENRIADNSIGKNGHGAREELCGDERHPHRESDGAANSESGPAENPSGSRFSGFIVECPIGENGQGHRQKPCGFDQHPHAKSASAAKSGPEFANDIHFSAENPKFSESDAKRKEGPCLSPDECCDEDSDANKRKKRGNQLHPIEPHLANGVWNLTREHGTKLLQSRFRGDILYICDWPGCIHSEEKRNYRLFRGIFKNFKNSHVWRNVKDMKAKKTVLNCAFCPSMGTWDMLTTFCLRRSFEYHDDGEPVVRAYVCENGHVAGAWTDRPMYN